MGRSFGGDPKPNAFMCIAFAIIPALGIAVFFTTPATTRRSGFWLTYLTFAAALTVSSGFHLTL